MTTPSYPPELLSRLIWETTTIEDHAKLAQLYIDLHEQGDIDFNAGLKWEMSSPKHYYRFLRSILKMDALCDYCLTLVALQEKGLATVTLVLKRRIDFQREILTARKRP
ncbi:MAG: hypothetical protein ACOH1X_02770 [Kaistella sp.]